jgi:hypothetical protein
MAALATGVVQYMIDGMNFGWSVTIFGGLASISALLYFFEMKRGMKWRDGKTISNLQGVTVTRLEEPLVVVKRVNAEDKVGIIV